MSRNLMKTSCAICDGKVVLTEKPRPSTAADCGAYFEEYKNLVVAHAVCSDCDAKYIAWVDIPDDSYWKNESTNGTYFHEFLDLSFRCAFNDEPDTSDLPTAEKLLAIARIERVRAVEQAKERINDAQAELDDVRNAPIHSFWEAYRRE